MIESEVRKEYVAESSCTSAVELDKAETQRKESNTSRPSSVSCLSTAGGDAGLELSTSESPMYATRAEQRPGSFLVFC